MSNSKVVEFKRKNPLNKTIAQRSMAQLLAEADLPLEEQNKEETPSCFQIIWIIPLPSSPLNMAKVSDYDKTRICIIQKAKSGKVYRASFGRKIKKKSKF